MNLCESVQTTSLTICIIFRYKSSNGKQLATAAELLGMRISAALVGNAAQHLRPHLADHLQRASATNRRVVSPVDEECTKRASSPQRFVPKPIGILTS